MKKIIIGCALLALMGCVKKQPTLFVNDSKDAITVAYVDQADGVPHVVSVSPGNKAYLFPNTAISRLSNIVITGNHPISFTDWEQKRKVYHCDGDCTITWTGEHLGLSN